MKSQLTIILAFIAFVTFSGGNLQAINAPITTAGSYMLCSGSNLTIPVTVTDFTLITAVSLRLDFNPTQMTYTGSANLNNNLPGGIIINKVVVSSTLHKIMIIWSDFNPVTLTNGSKLLDLKFNYVSGDPILAFNNTANNGSDCEFADEIGDPMTDTPTGSYYYNATITNNILGSAGTIDGPLIVNPGESVETYTIPPITHATSYIWTLPEGATGSSTTNSILVSFGLNAAAGNITVQGQNVCGLTQQSLLPIRVSKIVQLKLFLEGLFDPYSLMMYKALDEFGEHFGEDIADQIDLEVRNAASPYTLEQFSTGINLRTNGNCQFFASPDLTDTYYIVIRHRNHIATWSAEPMSFAGENPSYDFTDQSFKAYGDNLKPIESIYAIFSGDINQDGVVDGLDIIPLENQASQFGMGYIPEDLNGDGSADALDIILLDNNTTAFVSTIAP